MRLPNQPKGDNGTVVSTSKHYLVHAFREYLNSSLGESILGDWMGVARVIRQIKQKESHPGKKGITTWDAIYILEGE